MKFSAKFTTFSKPVSKRHCHRCQDIKNATISNEHCLVCQMGSCQQFFILVLANF